MTDKQSPVEAITRDIEWTDGVDPPFCDVIERYRAYAELAKAYAMLRAWNFDPSLELTATEIDAKDWDLHKAETDAFDKLIEALQR